jgi:Terminase small subunit
MNKPQADVLATPADAAEPVSLAALSHVTALVNLKFPRWQRFVVLYATNLNLLQSARAAGYKGKDQCRKLLRHPQVAAALAAVRAEMAKLNAYDVNKLVADLDAAAEFARATENAQALVRAIEIKAKALGLLLDRVDMRIQQVPFSLTINTTLPTAAAIEGGT